MGEIIILFQQEEDGSRMSQEFPEIMEMRKRPQSLGHSRSGVGISFTILTPLKIPSLIQFHPHIEHRPRSGQPVRHQAPVSYHVCPSTLPPKP